MSTLAAHQKASCGCPAVAGHALGATEPGWPPQPGQIGTACTFCSETLFELGEGLHIVPHDMASVRFVRTGVKCIAQIAYKKYTNSHQKSSVQGGLRMFRNVRADMVRMIATPSRPFADPCNVDVTDSSDRSSVFKSSATSHDLKDHGNMCLARSGCREHSL